MKRSPRPEPPDRAPHPDPQTEARLRHVLAMYAMVRRAEARLADIGDAQAAVDDDRRKQALRKRFNVAVALGTQARDLRGERRELEEHIALVHTQIVKLTAGMDTSVLNDLWPEP